MNPAVLAGWHLGKQSETGTWSVCHHSPPLPVTQKSIRRMKCQNNSFSFFLLNSFVTSKYLFLKTPCTHQRTGRRTDAHDVGYRNHQTKKSKVYNNLVSFCQWFVAVAQVVERVVLLPGGRGFDLRLLHTVRWYVLGQDTEPLSASDRSVID